MKFWAIERKDLEVKGARWRVLITFNNLNKARSECQFMNSHSFGVRYRVRPCLITHIKEKKP